MGSKLFKPHMTKSDIRSFTDGLMSYFPEESVRTIAELDTLTLTVTYVNISFGMKKLRQIIQNGDAIDTSIKRDWVISVLSFTYFYFNQMTVTSDSAGELSRKDYSSAKETFKIVLEILEPDLMLETVNFTVDFLFYYSLWYFETFASDVLRVLLKSGAPVDNLITTVFQAVQNNTSGEILRVVYLILRSDEWYAEKDLSSLDFVNKLVDAFRKGFSEKNPDYNEMRDALHACLRCVCDRLTNDDLFTFIGKMVNYSSFVGLSEEDTAEYGRVVDYAVSLHKTKDLKEITKCDVFKNVLKLIRSSGKEKCSLGCCVLQHLLDRQGNKQVLAVPRMYFEKSKSDVKIGNARVEDEEFVAERHGEVHEAFMDILHNHASELKNIGEMYTVVAMFAVEVPCALTAAWVTWVALRVQTHALRCPPLTAAARHRLHALTLSLVSLVSWVHGAAGLAPYVAQVCGRRARLAPHLNPPMRTVYHYAPHHVLTEEPELFFEQWELRYGLWNHFNQVAEKKFGVLE